MPTQPTGLPRSNSRRESDKRVLESPFFLVGILLLCTAAVYGKALGNGFTNWDDQFLVTDNKIVQSLSWESVAKLFHDDKRLSQGTDKLYMPLVYLSYSVEAHFFGSQAWVYHLDSILIHLVNSVLVFFLVHGISRNKSTAFLTAMFFALHPTQVESVVWIAGRKHPLYSLFFLAAALSYWRYVSKRKLGAYGLAIIFYGASLFCQPTAVVMPFFLMFLDWRLERPMSRTSWLDKVPFVLLASVFAGIATRFDQVLTMATPGSAPDLPHITQKLMDAVSFYLLKIFIPIRQVCLYPESGQLSFSNPLVLTAFFFAVTAVVIWLCRRSTERRFGIFFFILLLAPSLVISASVEGVVADRYLYLASVGIFFLWAQALVWLFRSKKIYIQVLAGIFTACLLGFLSAATFNRIEVWKDSVSLWSDVITKYPAPAKPYLIRGAAYQAKGLLDKAISDYDKAIQLKPDFAEAYSNRGAAYQAKGLSDQALADCNTAIRLKPNFVEGYCNRGNTYQAKGLFDKAISDYDKAIQIKPDFAKAYASRGAAYQAKGLLDKALLDYDKAIQIKPNFAEAYSNRCSAYQVRGLLDQAMTDCNTAIQLKPDFADSYNNRGNTYQAKGLLDQAISDYNKAIQLKPNFARAYASRGVTYQTKGLLDKAISDYNKAIQIQPEVAEAYSNRAVAYQAKGLLDQALSDCDTAIRLEPGLAEAYSNRGNAHQAKGLLDQAISDYDKAIELKPDFAQAYNNRSSAYRDKGLLDRAVSDRNKALQIRSGPTNAADGGAR